MTAQRTPLLLLSVFNNSATNVSNDGISNGNQAAAGIENIANKKVSSFQSISSATACYNFSHSQRNHQSPSPSLRLRPLLAEAGRAVVITDNNNNNSIDCQQQQQQQPLLVLAHQELDELLRCGDDTEYTPIVAADTNAVADSLSRLLSDDTRPLRPHTPTRSRCLTYSSGSRPWSRSATFTSTRQCSGYTGVSVL